MMPPNLANNLHAFQSIKEKLATKPVHLLHYTSGSCAFVTETFHLHESSRSVRVQSTGDLADLASPQCLSFRKVYICEPMIAIRASADAISTEDSRLQQRVVRQPACADAPTSRRCRVSHKHSVQVHVLRTD
jgi:hypothetical protein